MEAEQIGELVWHKRGGNIELALHVKGNSIRRTGDRAMQTPLRFPGLTVRPVASTTGLNVLYRHAIAVHWNGSSWETGPVFAILGGPDSQSFSGSKANFRDIIRAAAQDGIFIYVVPASHVNQNQVWRGYVRLGYQRWLEVPCPRPSAIYNRVPTRNQERSAAVRNAKRTLESLNIPMFNPDYFNKKVIYQVLGRSTANEFLPETVRLESSNTLQGMVRRHSSVYLKPTGGSIGHGILRLDSEGRGYRVSVLKNSQCKHHRAENFGQLWDLVRNHRLAGEYVIQAAKPLILYQGRPCDFRILAQKSRSAWEVTGIGVRVAGPDTITTHVPNGGSIASADTVLTRAFGRDQVATVRARLEEMVRACAGVIDRHYGGQLGEMSMDVGIDDAGKFWFFEANAKPMKFDEPDIRERSIRGVIRRLQVLASH